jgi:excisionase family DNA binding protein
VRQPQPGQSRQGAGHSLSRFFFGTRAEPSALFSAESARAVIAEQHEQMGERESTIATPPRLATPVEAARTLNVSRGTIYRMAADGQLPTVRVRGSIRVPVRELERLCAGDEPKQAA